MIKMLKLVVHFSEDVGMNFGVNKCEYQCIERGKRKGQNQPLEVHELIVQEVEDGDNYKYLGIDESVGINDPLNKERVTKEYKARVKLSPIIRLLYRSWHQQLESLTGQVT